MGSGETAAPHVSSEDRREYRWELLAAVVLSLATLASAWCGFQASSWGTEYSHESRSSNSERFEAARQSEIVDRQISSDLLIFSTWLEATVNEQIALATEIEARFLPHFLPAFDAWIALPLEEGMHVPAGTPFERPEYVLSAQAEADSASARAEAAVLAADTASATSARYVLNSVLFASVLFLAGIASKLDNKRLAHAVVVVAGVALLTALWLLISSPVRF
ncbi:MAG: hypothetical protein L0G23_01760 [Ruaniaceae bacterium]|nr:hypothetical protein [Ruaniaceae bacterium]